MCAELKRDPRKTPGAVDAVEAGAEGCPTRVALTLRLPQLQR